MDITTTLTEIAALSINDRIHMVQAIWDGIEADSVYPDLTEPQKREIDRRVDEYDLNPDNTLTWGKSKHQYHNSNCNLSWSARS
jgi:putative addiction module component (TIGR02574 family)